ncbi:hypothetical protein K1X76_12865 [bacterium]|nr:hypothetical protein [bacterium]
MPPIPPTVQNLFPEIVTAYLRQNALPPQRLFSLDEPDFAQQLFKEIPRQHFLAQCYSGTLQKCYEMQPQPDAYELDDEVTQIENYFNRIDAQKLQEHCDRLWEASNKPFAYDTAGLLGAGLGLSSINSASQCREMENDFFAEKNVEYSQENVGVVEGGGDDIWNQVDLEPGLEPWAPAEIILTGAAVVGIALSPLVSAGGSASGGGSVTSGVAETVAKPLAKAAAATFVVGALSVPAESSAQEYVDEYGTCEAEWTDPLTGFTVSLE